VSNVDFLTHFHKQEAEFADLLQAAGDNIDAGVVTESHHERKPY
jgi:hypothetical protein